MFEFALAAIFVLLFIGFYFIFTSNKAIAQHNEERRRQKEKAKALKLSKENIVSLFLRRRKYLTDQFQIPSPVFNTFTAAGAAVGYLLGDLFFHSGLIAIVVAALGSLAPQLYYTFRLTALKTSMIDKIESSMLLLSNSYIATDDFVKTVKENLDTIEYRAPFEEFLVYVTMIDSNIETGLRRLEATVDNIYFSQWIDVLVMAQKDRTLKYLTLSIVDTMNDAKMAQIESDTAMASVWREYLALLALVFSFPIIIRVLMRDWYMILVSSLIGKGLLLLLFAAIVWSLITAVKTSKPIV